MNTSELELSGSGSAVEDPSVVATNRFTRYRERFERLIRKENSNKYTTSILSFSLVLFLFIVLKNAWLSDDSFITLRTVDNFLHGFGPTFNVDERVQAFTHPLWFFLLAGANLLEPNAYFSTLWLQLIVTTLAAVIFVFFLSDSLPATIVGLAALTVSKSFIDFSTSGLENPLTHLLIVLFALVYFRYQDHRRYVLWISILSSMMILNRMDTVLLFVPTLIYTFVKFPKWRTLWTMALSFSPFVAWEIFSVFYYGFLFPNTAYAKLNTGIPASDLFAQGVGYLISSFTFDPLLFIIIGAGILLPLTLKDWKSLPLILGVVLYMYYTVNVGGDFMAGRFLTPPFLVAVILLMRNIPDVKAVWIFILVVIAVFGLVVPNSRIYALNVQTDRLVDSRGVADEHLFYADQTGLTYFLRNSHRQLPASAYENVSTTPKKVYEQFAIGIFSYYAGPKSHIIDVNALTDPLLARLPVTNRGWRIGHFKRNPPAGYLETWQTGKNEIKDKNIAQYYDHLQTVVSDPLFSLHRFAEIWRLNTGVYDYLLPHSTLAADS